MRALSLWQPYASFMAEGFKLIETRSWSTPYTGLVAIHAAKTKEELATADELLPLLSDPAKARGFTLTHLLTLGAILAVGKLTGCARTTSLLRTISVDEETLGNYEPGRWGWVFEDIRRLPEPMPYKGQQGLWELPGAVASQLMEAVRR